MAFKSGKSDAMRSFNAGDISLNARAAATKISCLIRRTPDAITPNPTPGKM